MLVMNDNPILDKDDDALGRSDAARNFVQHIQALDVRAGAVVGILGAWGSGKTSFINLTRNIFNEIDFQIIDFNPWMFSGTEQLVQSFFIELASELKVSLGHAKIGKALEEYGTALSGMSWLPAIGTWVSRGQNLIKLIGIHLQKKNQGIKEHRVKLEEELSKLDKPIVVVLDDIDRLTSSEIRDIFRLVRLTARFPNLIYLVAFDRSRVEKALGDDGISGRDYLEKILQIVVDLPEIPDNILAKQTLIALDETLASIENPGHLDERVWQDIFLDIIKPTLRNMRDVRRYVSTVYGTVCSLGGQVALADVLALEAIRIFLPDVFKLFHGAIEGLTKLFEPPYGLLSDDPPSLKIQIDDLIEAAGTHADVVRALLELIFPAGSRYITGTKYAASYDGLWLQDRRVANKIMFMFYLERVQGKEFQAFLHAEQAFKCMANRNDFESYLRSIEIGLVLDVIATLEIYEKQYSPEHVVPGVIVLLNLLSDLPKRQLGNFEWSELLVVTRVTFRLLRSLKSKDAVEKAVRLILPELNSLSAKLELIVDIGYRPKEGHELVSEQAATEFERNWRDEVRAAPANDLSRERETIRILLTAKRDSDSSETQVSIDSSPALTLSVLKGATIESTTQAVGSRHVRRSYRLDWDGLIELYGNETILKERISELESSKLEGAEEVLELTKKHLT